MGDPGGIAHLLQVGVGTSQRDVLAHRRAQELGVLEDEGDRGVERLLIHVAQIHPADAHGAGVGVGEAGDEGGQRRLARARGAEQSGDGAGLQGERGLVNGEGVPVGEGDAVDLDARPLGPPGLLGRGQDGGVDDLAQSQSGGAGHLVGPGDRRDGQEGAGQHQGDEGGGQDLGQGDEPGTDEQRPTAEVDQEQNGDRDPREGQAGHGHQRHRPGPVEGGEVVGRVEVGGMGAPDAPERLDHADAGDELDHGGGDGGQLAVHLDGLLIHAAHGEGVGQYVQQEG